MQQFFARFLIQSILLEKDKKRKKDSGNINVGHFVIYNNKYANFEYLIKKAVDLHIDFWNELMEKIPDVNKLLTYGHNIYNYMEDISNLFKELCELDNHDTKCLKIYAEFLKQVSNDEAHSNPIFEK